MTGPYTRWTLIWTTMLTVAHALLMVYIGLAMTIGTVVMAMTLLHWLLP